MEGASLDAGLRLHFDRPANQMVCGAFSLRGASREFRAMTNDAVRVHILQPERICYVTFKT